MAHLIYSPAYREYDFGEEHPFSPLRVDMVLDLLRELGQEISYEEAPPATREELLTLHDPAYVAAVEAASAGNLEAALPFGLGQPDTPAFPGVDLASRRLVGGTLAAARAIADGRASKVLHLGGGLHHARRAKAAGFCVYNDLAVALKHLNSKGMYAAYLDIDVHHGDGVQDFFEQDDKVLTISLHESGQYLWPGTGDIREMGSGMGRGLKVNLPLEPFTEDESYLHVFEKVVPEALRSFGPAVLVVQAGADAHFDDPLADLMLTTQAYERLFHRFIELADEYAQGRLLVTLGGGYSVKATPRVWTMLYLILNGLPLPDVLPPAWISRWEERMKEVLPHRLHDEAGSFEPIPRRDEIVRQNRQVADRLLESMAKYWI
jgi:acetoin utilization protein AcuC